VASIRDELQMRLFTAAGLSMSQLSRSNHLLFGSVSLFV
jgi:hypothetical protein